MKKLLMTFAIMILAQPAISSDQFKNQIICSQVNQPGEADSGLDVIIQFSPTASEKKVVIVEKGFLGSTEIGSFKIPQTQPLVSTPSFFEPNRIATYEANGFELKMEVSDQNGEQVLGPAHAQIKLPGYTLHEVDLTCKSAALPMVATAAAPASRLICANFGNLNGSHYLDITGYEQILNGTVSSLKRTLGFKEFRSSIMEVADMSCAKPNPFLEGPGTLLACYSGLISDHRNPSAVKTTFEAAISQGEFGLVMTVRGPGIPAGYIVPCAVKDL